eukprot:CAMPEP_0171634932 /NCGR_PEP_ID=MMETSP0990-20121206/26297_1 /TAXON_ID=483369 /ORGANISM="non described non described, Strain CCMP2098" /LENGTH=82 /DNA_ID=CAMNT_0012206343 /DNA_START=401 /DNA_END=649 /DNA_ORIENTATION=+
METTQAATQQGGGLRLRRAVPSICQERHSAPQSPTRLRSGFLVPTCLVPRLRQLCLSAHYRLCLLIEVGSTPERSGVERWVG